MTYDNGGGVLSVGEALVDIVHRADGSPDAEHPGGSPANVALGLGRLGHSARLLTWIADDDRGRRILEHLAASNVQVVPESIAASRTPTAIANVDLAGVASYDFDIEWQLWPGAADLITADTLALHTASIAAFLQPGGDAVLDLIRLAKGRTTISYDPNARPRLMGEAGPARERVERFVAGSDVVKVSDEDLAWLCPGEDPEDVATAWLALGPAVVVVTRGGDGAFARFAAGRAEVPGQAITVADTVGAGDSFSAALIDHLAGVGLLGADRLEALRAMDVDQVTAMLAHAVRISAITCQRPGADPPWLRELS